MAVLSFVAALLVIGTLVLWLFQLNATASRATLGHYYSTGALYADVSGIEMVMLDLTQGGTGTISDNGDPSDDPALATGVFYAENDNSTNPPTYRAFGRPAQDSAPWDAYRRIVEVQAE